MGFASNIVIGTAAFLLGMVFVCQVVDIGLLYLPLTNEAIQAGYEFYEMWYEAPGAVKALFHVAMGIPMLTLIIKLNKWSESAKFFDGSALAMMTACVVLYLSVHIQSLRTFLPDAKSTWSIIPAPPVLEQPATETEKIEALRVLSAGNALVGLLLLGVIGMQIGQEYAHYVEAKEQKALDEAAARSDADSKKNI
ncbi:hypothetical protein CspHIS471_0402990 [Cutaneotrichosporon sp. HIS471]|nr:hypothetical protein CspHIS471_0402990 [Cutaneotrichosporon sp. HIS471]